MSEYEGRFGSDILWGVHPRRCYCRLKLCLQNRIKSHKCCLGKPLDRIAPEDCSADSVAIECSNQATLLKKLSREIAPLATRSSFLGNPTRPKPQNLLRFCHFTYFKWKNGIVYAVLMGEFLAIMCKNAREYTKYSLRFLATLAIKISAANLICPITLFHF